MGSIPGFVGGSDVLNSQMASSEEVINWFQETVPGTGKRRKIFKSRAGLRTFAQFEDSPGRGAFAENGRAFAAVGSSFGEVFEDGTTVTYGSINNTNGLPVWMCSNGSAGGQIGFVSDGIGYMFNLNTNTLAQIPDVNFPANAWQMMFFEGYFAVSVRATRQFRYSDLENGDVWPVLNVAERSIASDNIVAFIRRGREMWLIGEQTTEVWYNQGDVDTPFAPISGLLIEVGCAAGYSAQRLENTLGWISQSERGGGMVHVANGFTPDKLSSYAIDLQLQDSGNLEFAYATAFDQKGHRFYQISLPVNETPLSPTFDFGEGLWHQRGMWNTATGMYEQDLAAAHMYAFSKNLMLSRLDGTVYWLRDDAYDDGVL